MAIFYLIRHGQPDYTAIDKHSFPAFGRDLAPLSEEGKQQAAETAKDIRLKQAEIIVSSPYTRALQTAAAISREIGLDIQVEVDLHEWLPDLGRWRQFEPCLRLYFSNLQRQRQSTYIQYVSIRFLVT